MQALGARLRMCLLITCLWKPAESLQLAAFDSISTKQAANRRAKTSCLGYLAAYGTLLSGPR